MRSVRVEGAGAAIGREDAGLVLAVAGLAGIGAAFAGCQPTASSTPDAVLTFALGFVVAWLAATAPWWALATAGVAAAALSLPGPVVLTALAASALAVAVWIGRRRSRQPVLSAVVGATVVQVVLRSEWQPWFGASALAAGAVLALCAVAGLVGRPPGVRRRVLWASAAVGASALLAGAGLAAAAVPARSPAVDGYDALLDGLEHLERGDTAAAATAMRRAAEQLEAAHDDLTGPLAAGARWLPVVAQHARGGSDVLGRAVEAAATAAATLETIDLDRLRIVDGSFDIAALSALEQPLGELAAAVGDLQVALADARSPWLVALLEDRLDDADEELADAAHLTRTTAAAARVGPPMLGADGPRRYLLVFTNPAESRGLGGVIGTWTELAVDAGAMTVATSGSSAELEAALASGDPVLLDVPPEFVARYAPFGAGSPLEAGADAGFWRDATTPPDLPTAGDVIAQLYRAATGRTVDGVVVVDPFAVASLLEIAGSIEVPGLGATIGADDAELFLVLEQYRDGRADGEDLLVAVAELTISRLLTTTFPPPQTFAEDLSAAALGGHLSLYATRPEEQELLSLVGIDAAMPTAGGSDLLAITSNNAGGNKIDSYLQRAIEYRPVHDAASGRVDGELSITLANEAPVSGSGSVVGNDAGLPPGTNRTIVTIYSPLDIGQVTVDGVPADTRRQTELGLHVAEVRLDLPPGGTVTIATTTSGTVAAGDYELVYRPQPLPNPDRLRVEASTPDGAVRWTHTGEISRRSVLGAGGVRAWR